MSIDELTAVNRELVTQCARRNRQFEQDLEKCFEDKDKLLGKINQLNATIQILESEIESLKNVPSSIRKPSYSTTYFGEHFLKFGNCDPAGNDLELLNRSDRAINLDGYRIRRIIGDTFIEVILPPRTIITSSSILKIFGRQSLALQETSQSVRLSEIETWLSGEIMQTFLLDRCGKEITSIVQTLEE